ncbi:MAG TPA: hypothetical protein VGA78_10650, partial [Gemmatimonadales bacterium]
MGSGVAGIVLDTVGQSAYWYTDPIDPAEGETTAIGAGNYTLNMFFGQLPEATASEQNPAAVDVVVTVSHTAPDGSGATTIVSSSTVTIDGHTPNPYAVSIGDGDKQTFDTADPRRLRVQIEVGAVSGSGRFTLGHDSSSTPSSLATPAVVSPNPTLISLAAAIFIPPVSSVLLRRRRLSTRLISVGLSMLLVLAVLSQSVVPASGAPDVFYLHNSAKSGVTPAGKQMNVTQGTGASTLVFDTAGQDAYWYSELSYPTGTDNGGLAAGAYSLNLYFSSLPAPGFPQVVKSTSSVNDTANTQHTVSLPSGIQSGNLLIVIFGHKGGTNETVTWPGGWTQFLDANQVTNVGLKAAYRKADGTEGSTITVQTTNSVRSSHNSYRITGAEDPATQPPESAASNGNNANPNPASLTPTGGAKNYLWIAAEINNDGTNTITAYPASYSGGFQANGNASNSTTGSARRELNASSEDPGSFTLSASIAWAAGTIVVHPAAAPSVDIAVYAHHTATDGSGETLITSATTTITNSTANPLALSLGSGSQQTFNSGNPRLLRAWVEVTG